MNVSSLCQLLDRNTMGNVLDDTGRRNVASRLRMEIIELVCFVLLLIAVVDYTLLKVDFQWD